MDFKCGCEGKRCRAVKGDTEERGEKAEWRMESESKASEGLLKCAVDGADGSVNSNKAHIPRRHL